MTTEDLEPCPIILPHTAPDDPRVGQLLARGDGEYPLVAIVGFPCDEGVIRNQGRPGAAAGPRALRRQLYRMTPDSRQNPAFRRILGRTVDLGDIRVEGSDLEGAQLRLGRVVGRALAWGARVIVLGGGHETSFGHFLGYTPAEPDPRHFQLDVLNWDAHADLRPHLPGRGHSGSPFRQILEHPCGPGVHYTAAGLLEQSNAEAYLNQFAGRARFVYRPELSMSRLKGLYAERTRPLMVSFDLDAVDQAFAPGVSAPSCGGLDVWTWLEAARLAGRCPRTRSMDVVELNPSLDRDDGTARLAAQTVWQFLAGLAELLAEDGKPTA